MKTQVEIKPGLYRHYKGKLYRVIGIGKHSETLEDLVFYEALYEDPAVKLWVRPLKMFLENVEVTGQVQPRFEYLNEAETKSTAANTPEDIRLA